MAISFVSEAEYTLTAQSGDTTLAMPASLQMGDIVVILGGGDFWLNPDGTDQGGCARSQGWNVLHEDTNNSSPGRQLLYKKMGASPDANVTWEYDDDRNQVVVMQAFRGVDPDTPIDATLVVTSSGVGDPDPGSYTTVTPGALRIIGGVIEDDVASAVTAPAGYGDLIWREAGGGVGETASAMLASKLAASAGAENPAAFDVTGAFDAWVAFHFALRPAEAGGGGAAAAAHMGL